VAHIRTAVAQFLTSSPFRPPAAPCPVQACRTCAISTHEEAFPELHSCRRFATTSGARLVSLILVQPVTITANSTSAAAWRGFMRAQVSDGLPLASSSQFPLRNVPNSRNWAFCAFVIKNETWVFFSDGCASSFPATLRAQTLSGVCPIAYRASFFEDR